MKERQEQIKLLARVNRGKVAAPAFLANLSSVLGETISQSALLSPAETDKAIESLREGYRTAIQPGELTYRKFFRCGERALVLRIADCLAQSLSNERVFFVTKSSKDCGAVHLNILVSLSHTASILRLDGDSLSAVSEDYKQGILIDQNQDDAKETYEVVLWGDRWPILVLACN